MIEMRAKFASFCVYKNRSGCVGRIDVGDKIVWERDVGAWHEQCGPTSLDLVTPDECVFCSIIAGTTPATWVISPDSTRSVVCFKNRLKWASVMLLVVPVRHMSQTDFWSTNQLLDATRLAVEMGEKYCGPDGFRVVSNFGRVAGQSQFHAHLHVISGSKSPIRTARQKSQFVKTVYLDSAAVDELEVTEQPFLIQISSTALQDQRRFWSSTTILAASKTGLAFSQKLTPIGFRLLASFAPIHNPDLPDSDATGLFLLGGGELDNYV